MLKSDKVTREIKHNSNTHTHTISRDIYVEDVLFWKKNSYKNKRIFY